MTDTPYSHARRAENTMRSYRSQWAKFMHYCDQQGTTTLPAEPGIVAGYLAQLADDGLRASSISVARAAIDWHHSDANLPPPGKTRDVRNTLDGINRRIGIAKQQKAGLTASVFKRMCDGLDDNPKHAETLATIAVMRDALLRGSEVCAAQVKDFQPCEDGTARFVVRRSKTDQYGKGAIGFLSEPTTARVIRHLAQTKRRTGYLFRGAEGGKMAHFVLSRRIKRAVFIVGMDGSAFSAHSPRIGMTQDLAAQNIDSVAIAQAGRWKTPDMVIHYTRNQSAGNGAVARFYEESK